MTEWDRTAAVFLAEAMGVGCHDYDGSLFRSDDFSFLLSLCCTILRLKSMTPKIACDSKSPMIDRLGPLARPRSPTRYLVDSRAWPSPLWAYNTFSYVLFLSTRFPLCSILFHSVSAYAYDLTCLHSIPFDSLLLVSPLFSEVPSLARDLRLSLYINHCTI